MNLKILVCLVAIYPGCSNSNESNILIVGQAINMKAGAVVITKDSVFYFVDGLTSWDTQYYGKEVEVAGRVIVESNQNDRDENGKLIQTMVGTKRIIKEPNFHLVQ